MVERIEIPTDVRWRDLRKFSAELLAMLEKVRHGVAIGSASVFVAELAVQKLSPGELSGRAGRSYQSGRLAAVCCQNACVDFRHDFGRKQELGMPSVCLVVRLVPRYS